MTLENAYYVSQIIAAVAVVASLIYLALQTRQTGRAVRAQMNQARNSIVRETLLLSVDPNVSATLAAGFAADPAMNAVQCRQFFFSSWAALLGMEETYREWREGLISEDRWKSTASNLKATLASPGYRAAYKLLRPRLDPGFAAIADRLVEEVGAQSWRDVGLIWQAAAADELAKATVVRAT